MEHILRTHIRVKYQYYYKVLQFTERRQRSLTVQVIHASCLKYLYEFIDSDPQLAIVLRGSDRFYIREQKVQVTGDEIA